MKKSDAIGPIGTKSKLACVVVLLVIIPVEQQAIAAGVQCGLGSMSVTRGGTACECPSLVGDGGLLSGGNANIQSRRLTCSEEARWIADGSFCLNLDYSGRGGQAQGDFKQFYELFCPASPSPAETAKALTNAPENVIDAALQAICSRVPAAKESCETLREAVRSLQ